ncbi:MAG: glycosyltransferase domain-containing protein [Thomasclavelia sp.]
MVNHIHEIERLNKEYINLINSNIYKNGLKIEWLKNFKIIMLLKVFIRKIKFYTVKEQFNNVNLDISTQRRLEKEGDKQLRIVIYTCITGKYDKLTKPYFFSDNIEYILYSNDIRCEGWLQKEIPTDIKLSNSMINRYIKFHPYELFENNFDYAIYIDGNITPVSDLSVLCEMISKDIGIGFHKHYSRDCVYEESKACKILKKGNRKKINQQLQKYKDKGLPKKYGLIEGNFIIYDLHNKKGKDIVDQLWKELISSQSGRDQLAWPYILWKNNIKIDEVCTLGNNVYNNVKIRIQGHSK